MEFEFDEQKSISNEKKHGIDFIKVQALWDDEERLEIPAKTVNEPRFIVLGKIASRVWAVVITYRRERIRIISARRARTEERALYESERF